jgi:hypothetical protein
VCHGGWSRSALGWQQVVDADAGGEQNKRYAETETKDGNDGTRTPPGISDRVGEWAGLLALGLVAVNRGKPAEQGMDLLGRY